MAKATKKERLAKLDEITGLTTTEFKHALTEADVALVLHPPALKDILDLTQDSPIDMILYQKGAEENAQTRYEALRKGVADNVAPKLQEYLTGLNLEGELKKVTSIEQLAQTVVIYIPETFREQLAAHLDGVKDIELYQKVWLFDHFINLFATGVEKQIRPVFEKRAQQLVNAKRKIIVP